MVNLIKGYFKDNFLRHELNKLTRETFCFDFEGWYQSGGYTGDYIPYSFEKDGRILSNASANLMRFMQNGKEKSYIQIGTVMTAEDCRNQGYARSLISSILEDYKEQSNGIYLFGNLDVLGFYEKMGFEKGTEYRYSLKNDVKIKKSGRMFEKVDCKDTGLVYVYKQMLLHSAVNSEFEHINRYGLMMFYTSDLKQVYYSKDLGSFICFEVNNNVLSLNSIISQDPVQMSSLLERLPGEYHKILLNFTPLSKDRELFSAEKYDGGDEYRLFYIGKDLQCIEKEKLFFPQLSHA